VKDAARILTLAERFRRMVEAAPKELLPLTFEAFPHGACGDAALLLGEYLKEHGETGFSYVLAFRDGWSHAWLDRDGLIVDVTADQFEDAPAGVIVSRRSDWHATFAVRATNPTRLDRWDEVTAEGLWSAYKTVLTGRQP
jgi:hypothetical protein